jgi:hypothetical protein
MEQMRRGVKKEILGPPAWLRSPDGRLRIVLERWRRLDQRALNTPCTHGTVTVSRARRVYRWWEERPTWTRVGHGSKSSGRPHFASDKVTVRRVWSTLVVLPLGSTTFSSSSTSSTWSTAPSAHSSA